MRLQVVGILLIAWGMFAGASKALTHAAVTNMQKHGQGKETPAYSFGQSLGGALCSLVSFGAGVYLCLPKKKQTYHKSTDESSEEADYLGFRDEAPPPRDRNRGSGRREPSRRTPPKQDQNEEPLSLDDAEQLGPDRDDPPRRGPGNSTPKRDR